VARESLEVKTKPKNKQTNKTKKNWLCDIMAHQYSFSKAERKKNFIWLLIRIQY
jgi:hypothetical protein